MDKHEMQDFIMLRVFPIAIAITALLTFLLWAIKPEPEAELIIGTGEPVCECAACIPPEGRE